MTTYDFELFERSTAPTDLAEPQFTISGRDGILNAKLVALLGGADFVLLHYDRGNTLIAFEPVEDVLVDGKTQNPNAFPVRSRSGNKPSASRVISMRSYLQYYQLDKFCARRYTGIEKISNGMIIVRLLGPSIPHTTGKRGPGVINPAPNVSASLPSTTGITSRVLDTAGLAPMSPTDNLHLKCAYCPREFGQTHGLQVHVARSHKGLPAPTDADYGDASAGSTSAPPVDGIDIPDEPGEPVVRSSALPMIWCHSCTFSTEPTNAVKMIQHTRDTHGRPLSDAERTPTRLGPAYS